MRFGIGELPAVLAETGIGRPLVVTTSRWAQLALPVEARRFTGARPHAERTGVEGARAAAGTHGADGLLAIGGGSAIDTAKAVSAETGLPVVAVPTTYAGAEWTTSFGSRDAQAGVKRSGTGARIEGIVYEPALTLELPPVATCGTALNALAHCAEALYTRGRSDATDADALEGAALIARWLPAVLQRPFDLESRTELLRGAMHAGKALRAGMGVGHAMAQALGGRFGLAHGTMNAVCLPLALRFNADAAPEPLSRFAGAIGGGDPAERAVALAALACPTRLREVGVPRGELPRVAQEAAERPAAKANPRPATPEAILELLESAW